MLIVVKERGLKSLKYDYFFRFIVKSEASKLLKRSLRQLIKNAKPSKDEVKAQKTVEKKLSKFLKVRLQISEYSQS